MKTTGFIFILVFMVSTGACAQQIPNAGFESWIFMGGWFENPDGWTTNNNQIVTFVAKDSNAHQGNLSAALHGGGYCSSRFQFPFRPAFLDLYVKSNLVINDTAEIVVYVYLGGTVSDTGYWVNTSNNPLLNWTEISVPFTQHMGSLLADSLEIRISVKSNYGSVLNIDDLSPIIPIGIESMNSGNSATIFPDPFHSSAILKFENDQGAAFLLQIFNSNGQLVRTENNITSNCIEIRREELCNGIYYFRLQHGNAKTIIDTFSIY